MAVLCLDTSALLKRYQVEKGTPVVREVFQSSAVGHTLAASYLAIPEASSVLTRMVRGGLLRPQTFEAILWDLIKDADDLIFLHSVSDGIVRDAVDLTIAHAVRAPDAIHLATALRVQRAANPDVTLFVSSDAKLKAAATASHLNVLDPEAPDSLERLRSLR